MLPASAGMIRKVRQSVMQPACAPRIRGDDPVKPKNIIYSYWCSPHPRG